MLCNLEHVLSYTHPNLLKRYTTTYPNNILPAEIVFKELLKYLWLCERHRQDQISFPDDHELKFVCNIYPEISEIDDMWHTFLLFTKDYRDFCQQYLGAFIDHCPNISNEPISTEIFELDLSRYLSYVYEKLGEETLKIWFADYV